MRAWSLHGFIVLVIIAAICGAIRRAIAGGTRGGCLVATALGLIGALLGSWISHLLSLPEPLAVQTGGHMFPVVWSVIGSALLVAVLSLFARRRAW